MFNINAIRKGMSIIYIRGVRWAFHNNNVVMSQRLF